MTRARTPCKASGSYTSRDQGWAWRPKRAWKWKVEPRPALDSAQIRPPIISTRFLEIARPSPVPPYLRVVEASAWLKLRKVLASCSGVMPIPESWTQKCSSTSLPRRSTRSAPMMISPLSVNFTALLPRLTRTWPRRRGSPISAVGRLGARLNSSSIPLSSAFRPMRLPRLSMTSSRLKSMCSMDSLPASILEKSRMSLMMPSRFSAERCTLTM